MYSSKTNEFLLFGANIILLINKFGTILFAMAVNNVLSFPNILVLSDNKLTNNYRIFINYYQMAPKYVYMGANYLQACINNNEPSWLTKNIKIFIRNNKLLKLILIYIYKIYLK